MKYCSNPVLCTAVPLFSHTSLWTSTYRLQDVELYYAIVWKIFGIFDIQYQSTAALLEPFTPLGLVDNN